MKRVDFLKSILKGKRFDAHSIPVEVLSEFAVYKDIVYALAKHLYLQGHAGRKRLPKGFKEQLQLSIGEIGDGSAIAQMVREFDDTAEDYPEFDQARDVLGSLIENKGENFAALNLPENVISLFVNFGRTLAPDEEMLLAKPGQADAQAPKYSPEIRNKILSITKKPFSASVRVQGRVSDVNLVSKRFEILTDDEAIVAGSVSSSFEKALRDAHRDFENTEVVLVGQGLIRSDRSIDRVEKVSHLIIIKDENCTGVPAIDELEKIRALEQGWFDGEEGKTVDPRLVDSCAEFLNALCVDYRIPYPYIYPVVDGHIQAEWTVGPWEISACFTGVNEPVLVHATRVVVVESREMKLQNWSNREAEAKDAFAQFFGELISFLA